jgi:hypothetical protein
VADRYGIAHGAGAVAVLAALCGCSPATGDLGRQSRNYAAEQAFIASFAPEQFNETDQEREMHDRVWRFLRAPHVLGWFEEEFALVHRPLKPAQRQREVTRYYRWLSDTDYSSSRVRYNTIGEDATADVATLPTTFASICAVVEIDRQRAISSAGLTGIEPDVRQAVTERKLRNDDDVGTFTLALRFRYDSYSYAIDHLLVETPHEEAVHADGVLGDLAAYVDRAESGDFCRGGAVSERYGSADVIPPRIEQSTIALPDAEANLPRK